MLIKKWMSKPVITVEKDASLMDVANLFKRKIISMVPVVENGKPIGIVTDGDIKKASPSEATSLDIYELMSLVRQIKIDRVMSSPVLTVPCEFTVDEAASMMLSKNISGMPVMGKDGKMVGIITKSDIFRCFVSFTGVANKGQVFAFKIKDKPGIVQGLINTIRENNGRLSSIMTSYDDTDEGFRKIFIHTFGLGSDLFDPLVNELRLKGEMIYAADQKSGRRIVF